MWLILCVALLFSSPGAAVAEKIELFDSDQQKVVATFDNSEALQAEAQHILDSVSGRVLEFSPSLDHVMIVKIPLTPPKRLVLRSAGIDADIAEMFVIMPKRGGRAPWLILHTKEYETVVVEFARGVQKLKEQVRLP
ncbi:hypothetical protein ACFSO0_06635 [Brevibacillus sp. GCM10020057]|uniref:hypothetical protein n=1 Tax=Brevibacillus sp. GCM10020057 TaxID=3317327 RepID=UPI00362BA534